MEKTQLIYRAVDPHRELPDLEDTYRVILKDWTFMDLEYKENDDSLLEWAAAVLYWLKPHHESTFIHPRGQLVYRGPLGLYENEPTGWMLREVGYNYRSKWDMISNTCERILEEQDNSPWAAKAVRSCTALLAIRKRWDYGLIDKRDAKTILEYHWTHTLWEMGIRKTRKLAPRGWMTRDPYIWTAAAAVMTGQTFLVNGMSPPLRCYNPSTWAFMKFLRDPSTLNYYRFKTWDKIENTLPAPPFAQKMRKWRAWAAEQVFNQ